MKIKKSLSYQCLHKAIISSPGCPMLSLSGSAKTPSEHHSSITVCNYWLFSVSTEHSVTAFIITRRSFGNAHNQFAATIVQPRTDSSPCHQDLNPIPETPCLDLFSTALRSLELVLAVFAARVKVRSGRSTISDTAYESFSGPSTVIPCLDYLCYLPLRQWRPIQVFLH